MVHATRTMSGRETLSLSLNGKPDATSHDDLPTQLLLGHVPLFLAPQPRDVLVIDLASGVTAGAPFSPTRSAGWTSWTWWPPCRRPHGSFANGTGILSGTRASV